MHYKILNKSIPLSEIATKVNGRLLGNPTILCNGICSIDQPKENALSLFTSESQAKLGESISNNKFSAILVNSKYKFKTLDQKTALIFVENPIAALVKCMELFVEFLPHQNEISSKAEIHPSANLGKNVFIGAYSVIAQNVTVGENVVIHPHVVIYEGACIGAGSVLHSGSIIREYCEIGKFSVIQNGAVIGSDGFGYFFDGKMLKAVPQIGVVKLQDFVDVGANSCIDRAALGTTEVGLGSKLDNLVQVGHNVKIGKMSILCGQVGIGGSSKIGNGVTLGGQAGTADHSEISDNCRFAAKSGVIGSFKEAGDYSGMPAIPVSTWRRQIISLKKLPDLLKKLNKT
ncbi:MAG: UDP-3-O-(3-hydroxymyristoyl)glucosamine N-acyltransferase [bacterium]|nr:UDP-3-O-(3-hydroxymyristoyl)glucosamine N-acyltransferase [bacterium]